VKHRKVPRWVATVDAMARQAPASPAMRETQKTPFPFPPVDGAEVRFPDKAPLDVEIFRMSNWWLKITCACGDRHTPLRLLAAEQGWRITLRQLVPKFRCQTCLQRPTSVLLEDNSDGGSGRFGATVKTLRLV
jgi:hypothetical protein